MVIGIGTDIVEVSRFENASPKFMAKIFTPSEINYLSKKNLESIAGLFAAKEAVAKCLGVGFGKISPREIEICHDKKNAPFVKLHDGALKFALQLKISDIKISISHEKKYAIAFALAQN